MRSCLQLAVSIKNKCLNIFLLGLLGSVSTSIHAQPSVPYMPSWQARHQLERLVDEAGLQITTTHWPLPASAVQNALDDLPSNLSPSLLESKQFISEDIRKLRRYGKVEAQFRNKAEAPVGFGENYT